MPWQNQIQKKQFKSSEIEKVACKQRNIKGQAHHSWGMWGLEGNNGLGATKVMYSITMMAVKPVTWQNQTAFSHMSTIHQETCDRPKQYGDSSCVTDMVSSPTQKPWSVVLWFLCLSDKLPKFVGISNLPAFFTGWLISIKNKAKTVIRLKKYFIIFLAKCYWPLSCCLHFMLIIEICLPCGTWIPHYS